MPKSTDKTNGKKYQRDAAGGGTVNRFSAKTRKAEPITKEEYHADIKKGVTPNAARGSKTQYKVANDSMSAKGTSMKKAASTYRDARKKGMSPDEARGKAINTSNARMTKDAYGNTVR